jgi:hypothetical protein
MAKILLNDNDTGADITIDDSLLIKAFTSNSITNVVYLEEEDGYRKTAKVSEALTSVGNESNLLFSTTDADSNTVWINKERVTDVYDDSSLAVIEIDAGGAQVERFNSGDTVVAVQSAIITKDGDNAYLTDSFTAAPNTILLDSTVGDVESNFTNGGTFTVFGEGDSNDGIYTVVSATFDGTNTVITVTETPTANASASGYVRLKAPAAGSTVSYSPGVANTGVTATHSSSDGVHFLTTLTVSQVDALTTGDNVALADGYLLYTFPVGVCVIESAYMSMGMTATTEQIADTPDVGLGTVIATGANAVLSAVSTYENILTGQTAADANNTATVKTVTGQEFVIEAADAHTLHFNVADTWADDTSGDLTADIAGTVKIAWTYIA